MQVRRATQRIRRRGYALKIHRVGGDASSNLSRTSSSMNGHDNGHSKAASLLGSPKLPCPPVFHPAWAKLEVADCAKEQRDACALFVSSLSVVVVPMHPLNLRLHCFFFSHFSFSSRLTCIVSPRCCFRLVSASTLASRPNSSGALPAGVYSPSPAVGPPTSCPRSP